MLKEYLKEQVIEIITESEEDPGIHSAHLVDRIHILIKKGTQHALDAADGIVDVLNTRKKGMGHQMDGMVRDSFKYGEHGYHLKKHVDARVENEVFPPKMEKEYGQTQVPQKKKSFIRKVIDALV